MPTVSKEDRLKIEENLKRLVGISKAMILKFTHDKLGIDEAEIGKFIDNTEIAPDYTLSDEVKGVYRRINGKIGVNPSRIAETPENNEDLSYDQFKIIMRNIGIINHELEHKFSYELSSKRFTKQFEEGVADLFSDQCIVYFMEEYPEELQKLGFNIDHINQLLKEVDRGLEVNISSYNGEADFARSSLEVIRQNMGKNYTAEYEYIFGDKEKFLSYALDAIGHSFLDILEEQKKDGNLGAKYNLQFNKMLFEILKDIPIKDERIIDESNRNMLYVRQDMLTDVITISKIIKYVNQQGIDIYDMHPHEYEIVKNFLDDELPRIMSPNMVNFENSILAGYVKNCRNFDDLKKFDFSIGLFENVYTEMIKSGNFTLRETLDFMEYRNQYDIKDLDCRKVLLDEIIKEYKNNRFENYTKNELFTIIKVMVNNVENPDKDLFDVVEYIDYEIPNKTEREQIEIGTAKLATSRDSEGNILDSIIAEATATAVSGLLSMKDRPDLRQDDYLLLLKVTEAFDDYLNKNAKSNPETLKQILTKLQQYESELDAGQEKSRISKQGFKILRDSYFKCLERDLKILELNHCVIPDKIKKYIKNKKIYDFTLESKLDIRSILNVQALLFINQNTRIFNLFNKKNLMDVFEKGGIAEGTMSYFDDYYMSKSDMTTYVKTLTEFTKNSDKNEEIQDIDKYTFIIDSIYKPRKEKEQEIKEEFMETIKEKLLKREHPEQDIEKILSLKSHWKSQFVLENMISNLESKVNSGDIESMNEDSLKKVGSMTKDGYLQEVCLEALKQKYIKYGYTTSSFISNNTNLRGIGRKAYLMSLGMENDVEQQKCLETLDRIHIRTNEVPINPQYVKTDDNIIIISKNIDKTFKVYAEGWGEELKNQQYYVQEQNKGKKGIFALFKSKEDKEMVTQSMLIERKEGIATVLNIYETGKFEIATLDTSGRQRHPKVIDKTEVKPTDIGNNGALVIKDRIPRQFVKHQHNDEDYQLADDRIEKTFSEPITKD